jgi:hypothetical protein
VSSVLEQRCGRFGKCTQYCPLLAALPFFFYHSIDRGKGHIYLVSDLIPVSIGGSMEWNGGDGKGLCMEQ